MLSVLASEEQGRKDCNTGASERGGFTVPLHVSHLGADSFDESSPPKAKALAPSPSASIFPKPTVIPAELWLGTHGISSAPPLTLAGNPYPFLPHGCWEPSKGPGRH